MTVPSFNTRLYNARQRRIRPGGVYDEMLAHIYGDMLERLSDMKRDMHRLVCLNHPALPAEALRQASGTDEITYYHDDALTELPSDSVDAVIGYVPLHANARPDLFLAETRRVLSPGGLMLTAFFGERSLHQLRARMIAHETAASGGAAARVMPMIDVKTAGMLLQQAGFSVCISDINDETLEYATPYGAIKELRVCGLGNILCPSAPLSKAAAIAVKKDKDILSLSVQTITLTAEK